MKTYKICRTKDGLVAPPGKLYLVSLDIADTIPFIKEVSLYAHRALSGNSWTVTEASTGRAFGHGKTKQEAVFIAQIAILKAGNAQFKWSIQNAKI